MTKNKTIANTIKNVQKKYKGIYTSNLEKTA